MCRLLGHTYGEPSFVIKTRCDTSFSSSCIVAGVLLVFVGYGGSRVDFPLVVVMALTFSKLVAKGRAVTNWAICHSMLLL